ncbi:hypothetical protein FNV43_RR19962 [Rhamnella rubrinervis]|uniref:Uncharacterized protein n=1 Tax=Rhamnella rubrinervis TaxID=2594499 RepID=A0A8K0E076_9ROSA|nr:hypothetical protein FNV43_RR19962 [Rhamnella rubrinervis]
MSTFRVPKGVCEDMDSIVRQFWWGSKQGKNRYLALRNWKELCKPKDVGGLGFRSFWDYNTALLSKLGWKIASGEESLWSELLKARYLRHDDFFKCEAKSGDSWVWKGILSTKKEAMEDETTSSSEIVPLEDPCSCIPSRKSSNSKGELIPQGRSSCRFEANTELKALEWASEVVAQDNP